MADYDIGKIVNELSEECLNSFIPGNLYKMGAWQFEIMRYAAPTALVVSTIKNQRVELNELLVTVLAYGIFTVGGFGTAKVANKVREFLLPKE